MRQAVNLRELLTWCTGERLLPTVCKLKNFENLIKEYRRLCLERDTVVGEKWFLFKTIYRRAQGDR